MSQNKSRHIIFTVAVVVLLVAAGTGIVMLGMNSGNSLNTFAAKKEYPDSDLHSGSASYSVTMSPVGTVTFSHPPQRAVTLDANYNDMLVSIGKGDSLLATGYQNNFFEGFYSQLAGFDTGIDIERLLSLSSESGGMFDKELLYQLNADIHHIDPLRLSASRGWSRQDVEEVARNIAPFFANRYSRERRYGGSEPYDFYTLWELSDKVAQVYQCQEKIAALKKITDKLIRDIQKKLPPAEKRPKVGLIYYGKGRITTYSLLHGGFGQAQYVAVGAQDAFAGKGISSYSDAGVTGTALDVEGLMAINPDVLIMPFAVYGKPGSAQGARGAYSELLKLKGDPVASRIKAFQHDNVYPGGTPLQGPLFFLFQVEMAAKQIYPEIFGRYRDDQNYSSQEQLFDRSEVAAIFHDKEQGK